MKKLLTLIALLFAILPSCHDKLNQFEDHKNDPNSTSGEGSDALDGQRLNGVTPSVFIDYFQGSGGFYGFSAWPFTRKSSWIVGRKEYYPPGFDSNQRYPCIIDGHGIGFASQDPTNLNEGLAKFINAGNEVINPIDGQKYIAICVAGGRWIGVEDWCNMIEYAFNHPNVKQDQIFIGGLSGGAMTALRCIGQELNNDGDPIQPYVQKIAGVYSLSGGIFGGYDPNIAATKKVLVHHGANDGQRSPTNVTGLRKTVGPSVTLNVFEGLGHSGTVWDAVWVDGNQSRNLVSVEVDGSPFPSDPYKSIWDFFIETVNTPSAPAKINNLSAQGVSTSQIDISWTNGFNGGNPITDIELQRSLVSTVNWMTIASLLSGNLTVTSESFVDQTGLSEATQYQYRIRRANSLGVSEWSNIAQAATQSSTGIGRILIDFRNSGTSPDSRYNTVNRFGTTIPDLKDEFGANTGFQLVTETFNQSRDTYGGTTTDGTGTKLHPDNVAQSLLFEGGGDEVKMTLSNLDQTKTYTVSILGTYNTGGARYVGYKCWNTVFGETNAANWTDIQQNARTNFNEEEYEAVFANFSPNSNGELFFSVRQVNGSGAAPIVAMRIAEN